MGTDFGRLLRPLHPLPEDIKKALEERGVMGAYHKRPAYQQNDYLGWIGRAKEAETRENRLQQMLDELQMGGVYMKMRHRPSQKSSSKKEQAENG